MSKENGICPYCDESFLEGNQAMCDNCFNESTVHREKQKASPDYQKAVSTNYKKAISKSATPNANTIKGYATIVYWLEIIIAGVVVLGGIAAGISSESAVPMFLGFLAGAFIYAIAKISKSFVYGYGIIVGHYEKHENE